MSILEFFRKRRKIEARLDTLGKLDSVCRNPGAIPLDPRIRYDAGGVGICSLAAGHHDGDLTRL